MIEAKGMRVEIDDASWVKATASSAKIDGCVVEVAFVGPAVLVRDSSDPIGPVLVFTVDEWAAFLAGVRAGEFEPVDVG
jgi:hypothetical protein